MSRCSTLWMAFQYFFMYTRLLHQHQRRRKSTKAFKFARLFCWKRHRISQKCTSQKMFVLPKIMIWWLLYVGTTFIIKCFRSKIISIVFGTTMCRCYRMILIFKLYDTFGIFCNIVTFRSAYKFVAVCVDTNLTWKIFAYQRKMLKSDSFLLQFVAKIKGNEKLLM